MNMVQQVSKTDSIFWSAVEIADAAERHRYLDQACASDPDLRRQLDELLAAYPKVDQFLERPACEADAAGTHEVAIAEGPGSIIGAYKLLQQIGEGGMGVVFMAEQERPVRRKVALKIIRPGMDTRQVIARFEAERQVLAMMDHPNIAKVLDAGTTDEGARDWGLATGFSNTSAPAPSPQPPTPRRGRPYFVMELVQGVPITEYCDQCNLATRERLELFVIVCQAVQHAHQKGVIHRDIKPTNVLVALQDGRPEPKIIDFGVAKAIDQRLTEHTQMTAFAQMVGTPLYMSPEQAELSPLGVDTRSDIYSLGVLLYELLTGTTPFDKERLHAVGYDELRRIINEEEPPRPSARITTHAADKASTVAERRRTDARRLSQQVRGELDWIVMKCLEKDRNRRYETPNSLARDIERYLHDEPVQACPPSTLYRLRKYGRRNKTLLAAGGAISAALVVGLGLSTWQYIRATTESVRAKAVANLLQEMLGSADLDRGKGRDYTVRELLDDSSDRMRGQLAGQPGVEADIRATIGGAYRSLGMSDLAQPHLERAIELGRQVYGPQHENVAAILVNYAWNLEHQKKFNEAEPYLREALDIYRKRGVTGAEVFRALRVLQDLLVSSGRDVDAERVTREAMAIARQSDEEFDDFASILHQYAHLKIKQGHFADGEKIARQAVDMHRRLHGEHRDTAHGLDKLAWALESQNKHEEAEKALRERLTILRRFYADDHASVRTAFNSLKKFVEGRGDKAALEALVKEEAQLELRSDSAVYHTRLAELLLTNKSQGGSPGDLAHQLIRRAIEGYGQVAVDHPRDLDRRLKAADGYVEITKLCLTDPEFVQEIREAYRQLTECLETLQAEFPASAGFQNDVAHRYRGWALLVEGNLDFLPQFEHAQRQAIRLFETLAHEEQKTYPIWFLLADGYARLGEALRRSARQSDAEAAFERAVEICEQHAAEIENNSSPREIVILYGFLGYYFSTTHRAQLAADHVRKAAVNAMRLSDPTEVVDSLYTVALMQARLGDKDGYRATCQAVIERPLSNLQGRDKLIAIWTPCIAPNALDDSSLPVKLGKEFLASSSKDDRLFSLCQLGAAHFRAGQYEQAAERLEEFVATDPGDSSPDTGWINYQRLFFAMTRWQLARKEDALQLLAEALPAVEKELQSPSSGWNRRATLELLRNEAQALIGQKETDEAVEHD
jgi:serine/threonine protein kinase/tetratricopeptide (TPR) repeat protein